MATVSTKYTKTAVILHWLIGFGIIFMFLFGWYMEDLPKEAPKAMSFDLFDLGIYTWQLSTEVSPRTFYFNLHKSLGITILGLIAFRVFWRLTHPAPALIKTMKAWEKKLANATHHALLNIRNYYGNSIHKIYKDCDHSSLAHWFWHYLYVFIWLVYGGLT